MAQLLHKIQQLTLDGTLDGLGDLPPRERLERLVGHLIEAVLKERGRTLGLQADLRKVELREKSIESEMVAVRQLHNEVLERIESLLDWIETKT